jgi:hypothetical protein
MAGAFVDCVSYGHAYGCASASASAKAWAKASATGIALAWADASSKCCKNTAIASAAGLAALQVKLLAMATASADASVCVIGAYSLPASAEAGSDKAHCPQVSCAVRRMHQHSSVLVIVSICMPHCRLELSRQEGLLRRYDVQSAMQALAHVLAHKCAAYLTSSLSLASHKRSGTMQATHMHPRPPTSTASPRPSSRSMRTPSPSPTLTRTVPARRSIPTQ